MNTDTHPHSAEASQGERPRVWPSVVSVLAAVGVLLVFVAAYWAGVLFNVVSIFVLVLVPFRFVGRAWGAWRKRLEYGLLRRPLAKEVRWHLLQCLNRWLFWGLWAAIFNLAILPIQLEPDEYRWLWIVFGTCLAVLGVTELVPAKRVWMAPNALFAVGWIFLAVQLVSVLTPPSASESVVLDAPFQGEWYVFQGGRSALVNHHYPLANQRHALDMVKLAGRRAFEGDPSRLESYAAFGAELFAPADGEVAKVVRDRPDMPVGQADAEQIVGNHVVIDIGQGRFVLMAHLMNSSVLVSEGDAVRRGQAMARCGNSGNTSEPHLHLQVQNRLDFDAEDLRTYPILFRNVTRIRGGKVLEGAAMDVRRNDRVVVRKDGGP